MTHPLRQPRPTSRRRPGSRRGGFTLMEVLATILLLAIVVPVAMQAVSASMLAATSSKHRSTAAALAEAQLARLIASGEWLNGATSGSFPEYPEYTWMASAAPWTDGSVVQLDVMVTWTTARRGEEAVSVSTLVYDSNATLDPAATDGAAEGTEGGAAP